MKNGNIGALVMGADGRGLGIVQSLGRHGIPVWVLKKSGHLLASVSCYATRSVVWPDQTEEEQLRFLIGLAQKYALSGWVLFPTDDEAVSFIGRNHACLSAHFRLTTQSWDVLKQVCDKRSLHELAHRLGISYPLTFVARSREELAGLKCDFPVIIKPALRERLNRLTTDKAWQADDLKTLLALYDQARSTTSSDLIMIQELVPGGGEEQFSFAAVCRNGRPLNWVSARRTRQFPMDFGRFSTYVETIEEPKVVEAAVRLLTEVGLNGLVEVEFKRDPRNGQFKVLDVNPRVWGWQTLGAKAGVDFAWAAFRLAVGEHVPEAKGCPGVRWFRMSADLPTAISEILNHRLRLRDYLKSFAGPLEFSVFARDDPVPGILEMPLQALRMIQRNLASVFRPLASFQRPPIKVDTGAVSKAINVLGSVTSTSGARASNPPVRLSIDER